MSEKEFLKYMNIDLTFIDKILTHMVGLTKQELKNLLDQNDENYIKDFFIS